MLHIRPFQADFHRCLYTRRFFHMRYRVTITALFAVALLFSACSGSKLNLDPAAGKALIGFSAKMVVKFEGLTARFAAAKNSKEAITVLRSLPKAMTQLYSEAKALQAQFKKQNFADFHKAAAKRNLSKAKADLGKSIAALKVVKVAEKDGKTVASIVTAARALTIGAEKGDADKLLADVIAATAVLRKAGDKKLVQGVTGVESASRFLAETALVVKVKAGAAKLQASMKKLNDQYLALEKKYKDDVAYKSEIKKMKEAMKKVK